MTQTETTDTLREWLDRTTSAVGPHIICRVDAHGYASQVDSTVYPSWRAAAAARDAACLTSRGFAAAVHNGDISIISPEQAGEQNAAARRRNSR